MQLLHLLVVGGYLALACGRARATGELAFLADVYPALLKLDKKALQYLPMAIDVVGHRALAINGGPGWTEERRPGSQRDRFEHLKHANPPVLTPATVSYLDHLYQLPEQDFLYKEMRWSEDEMAPLLGVPVAEREIAMMSDDALQEALLTLSKESEAVARHFSARDVQDTSVVAELAQTHLVREAVRLHVYPVVYAALLRVESLLRGKDLLDTIALPFPGGFGHRIKRRLMEKSDAALDHWMSEQRLITITRYFRVQRLDEPISKDEEHFPHEYISEIARFVMIARGRMDLYKKLLWISRDAFSRSHRLSEMAVVSWH